MKNNIKLKPFEDGIAAADLGIDIKKNFVVVNPLNVDNDEYYPRIGDIVKLDIDSYDELEDLQEFIDKNGNHWAMRLSELSYASNQKNIKKMKTKRYKFAVVYEIEEDPIQFFETKQQALKFIKELSKDAHSIKLLELKSIKEVNIEYKKTIILD